MKRILLLLLSVLIGLGAVAAQPQAGRERIRAIRVGYISQRTHLTPAQSAKFWPVYDQYTDELRQLRQSFYQKYKGNPGDEAQARRFIEDNLDYQDQEVDLKRKYKDQLLQIISAQQLAELYQAERDFKKLLLERLRNRQRQ